MIEFTTTIRVCYGDTDKMGVVYYGEYPRYFEIGRNEMIRSLGTTYKELEESGIILPVRNMEKKYHQSAYYDDLLSVRCYIKEKPQVKLPIYSEIFNEAGDLITEGLVTLAFFNLETGKPCRMPEYWEKIFEKHF